MQFWDLPILDPILSLLIAGYVLFNVFKNIKESFKIILQGVPSELSTDKIERSLIALDEIDEIHDCHVWTMDGEFNIATIHVIIKNPSFKLEESKDLKQKIRNLLQNEYQLEHVTLELESSIEDCTYKDCN